MTIQLIETLLNATKPHGAVTLLRPQAEELVTYVKELEAKLASVSPVYWAAVELSKLPESEIEIPPII